MEKGKVVGEERGARKRKYKLPKVSRKGGWGAKSQLE